MRKTGILATLTLGSIGVAAVFWSEIAWITVQFTDTPEAYAEFVRSYPGSRHQGQGIERLEELEWRHASRFGGVLGFQRYLQWLPEGLHVEEARRGLDDAYWREALAGGSTAGVEAYLELYPAGRNAARARSELEGISWDAAELKDSRATYIEFLERYPEGAHAQQAQARLQGEIYWEAFQSGSVDALLAFIDSNPPAELLEDAYHQLDDLYWDLATDPATRASLTRFLAQARGDEHRAEALYYLDDLTWTEARRARTRVSVETYLKKFPTGQYADQAAALMAEVDLREALEKGTREAVRKYVAAHPDSVLAVGARSSLETGLWARAEETDSLQAYEIYLEYFEEGSHAPAAERALQGQSALSLQFHGLIEVDVVSAKVGEVVLDVKRVFEAGEELPAEEPVPISTGVTIDFPVGTLLKPGDETASDIFVVEETRVRVNRNAPRRVSLRTICLADARIDRDADYLLADSQGEVLPDLLPRLLGRDASIHALQLAVWIALGDVTLAELRERRFGLPSPFPFETLGAGLDLLASAGLDVTKRRIWLDRAALGAALPSGRLRKWLAQPESVGDAVRFGTPDQLRAILAAGGNPNGLERVTAQEPDPLRLAIEMDRIRHGRVLLEAGANANAGRNGPPPLTRAIARGSADWARLLLEAGAVPDRTRTPHNAFSLAAATNQVDLLRLLLAAGASIDGLDPNDSPLGRAIAAGHPEALSFLLENGARPDVLGAGGATPLQLAALAGDRRCVQLLLEAGCDPHAQWAGFAPVDLAAFRSPDLVKLFHDAGSRETFFSAVALDDLDGIERRLAAGEGLDARGLDGMRPLHVACLHRSTEALGRLLAHGADLTARSDRGLRPLHVATEVGWTRGVWTLVRAGADVDDISRLGTAVQLAVRAGNGEMLAALLRLGADPNRKRAGEPSPLAEARSLMETNPEAFTGILEQLQAARAR